MTMSPSKKHFNALRPAHQAIHQDPAFTPISPQLHIHSHTLACPFWSAHLNLAPSLCDGEGVKRLRASTSPMAPDRMPAGVRHGLSPVLAKL
ncbi:hypothetical protein C8R44DRAFT_886070 [Mycena epipterygia]|nr:hypothetical protein C8R44DRAFT_886070 [Mycena epipterygia]